MYCRAHVRHTKSHVTFSTVFTTSNFIYSWWNVAYHGLCDSLPPLIDKALFTYYRTSILTIPFQCLNRPLQLWLIVSHFPPAFQFVGLHGFVHYLSHVVVSFIIMDIAAYIDARCTIISQIGRECVCNHNYSYTSECQWGLFAWYAHFS